MPTTKTNEIDAATEPTLTPAEVPSEAPGVAPAPEVLPVLATQPGALALPADNPWENVDSGYMGHGAVGLSLPLLQSDMRPDGGWIDQMTGEKLTSLDIVWLAWTESRAFWLEAYGKGSIQPDCRSSDTLTPDQASPHPQAEKCAGCKHSQWSGERMQDPPRCSIRVNVLAYLVADRRLTRISFGGTAIKYISKYIGGLSAMVPPRPPMAVVTHIGLEEVEEAQPNGSKMRWLEPRFSIGAEVDRTEAAPLIALRDEFTAQWRSLLAEDLSQPEAGAENVRSGPGPFGDAVEAQGRPYEPFPDEEPPADDEDF